MAKSDEKRVVIETFRWSNAIPKPEESNDDSSDLIIPVLLRAAAPRRGVDLVVIPNVDRDNDHGGKQLQDRMRKAMASMVKCLHQDDRLSLKGDGGCYTGLTDKASGNLEKTIDRSIRLTAREITLGIELKAACKVLEDRSPEESKCRLGLIVLLSAGHWVELREPTPETSRSKFPVYRILLTNKDSATSSMLHIAAGAHVCSVQEDDMETPAMEERAVKAFLLEAMSPAAATAVRIDVATFGGVAVSSIMSDDGREHDAGGKNKVGVGILCEGEDERDAGGKNEIGVGILCEGKDKKFVVNLRVPKEMRGTPWGIMEVSGCYKDAAADEVTGGGGGDDVQIEPSQVFLRTKLCPPEYMDGWKSCFKSLVN